MRSVFYVLVLALFVFALTSCSSGGGEKTVYVTQEATGRVGLKSVDNVKTEKSESYDKYIYIADYILEATEETTASVTLCLNQKPKNGIPEKKVFNSQEYTDMGFEVSNCSSVDIPVNPNSGKKTLAFNMLNSVMDVSSRQQIFGETEIFTFVNDNVSAVHYLGKISIDTIPPYISADELSYTEVVASSPWSIIGNKQPEFFVIPISTKITLSGSGADNITVAAEDNNNSVVTKMSVRDYNGTLLADIPFTLENVIFTPTRIQSDLKNENNNVVDTVDMNIISTTDEQHLPYVGMTFEMKIPYAALAGYLPTKGTNNITVDPTLAPVEAVLPVSFKASIKLPDGETTLIDTDSFDIDVVDFIYDIRDMWSLLYNAELLNGVDPAAKTSGTRAANGRATTPEPSKFSPVKYESQFFQESGDKRSFYGNIKFLAGVYTEEAKEADKYQMRAQADGSSKVSVIGYDFDVFSATLYATGQPATPNVTPDDSKLAFGYELKIFGKTVISDDMETNGRLKFKKHYTFEKEFASQGSVVVIVPFYYDVGGRGAVGVIPEINVKVDKKTISVPKREMVCQPPTGTEPEVLPWEALTPVTIVNPEKKLPWYVEKDLGDPRYARGIRDARQDQTFVYDTLPGSAKDYLTGAGLDSQIRDYEDFITGKMIKALDVETGKRLRREWTRRETANIKHDEWATPKCTVEVAGTTTKYTLGFDIGFKAKPYIEMTGYGRGGFGVSKNWAILKFSLGVGVEAEAKPLVYADVFPSVNAFIGIAGGTAPNPNQLLLELKYEAPFTYLLIRGKIWAGVHLEAHVWVFTWVKIVKDKWGRVLVDNKGIGGTYDIVKPFNQTWVFDLPVNTP